MSQSNWTEILHLMYEQNIDSPSANIDENHPFATKSSLGIDEAEDAVNKLTEWGLLEMKVIHEGYNKLEKVPIEYGYELTEKGFDVAHERELKEESQKTNFSLMALTAILALTALIQAISSVLILDGAEKGSMMIATTFILLLIVYISYKSWKRINGSTLKESFISHLNKIRSLL